MMQTDQRLCPCALPEQKGSSTHSTHEAPPQGCPGHEGLRPTCKWHVANHQTQLDLADLHRCSQLEA